MEQTKQKNRAGLEMLFIGLKLLLICAIVSGVVAFVYALTLEQYESNLQTTKNQAIGEIFSNPALTSTALSYDGEEAVYKVTEGESILGYCVEVASPGFGGDIQMMVGYDGEGKILGVSIISLSETPGLGSRVNTPDFLARFIGKGGELVLGEDIDAISGATVSSRAVTDGINAATAALNSVLGVKGGTAE